MDMVELLLTKEEAETLHTALLRYYCQISEEAETTEEEQEARDLLELGKRLARATGTLPLDN